MIENSSDINYDKLIEKSLKNVVIEALRIAESQGLPGENHYYITFRTNFAGVNISAHLKSQYPEEMTIVIQHQYSNLTIGENFFAIDLSFGGILQTLVVPFAAISYFADPHAKFGLSFNVGDESSLSNTELNFVTEIEQEPVKKASGVATVVSIDSFRRKK